MDSSDGPPPPAADSPPPSADSPPPAADSPPPAAGSPPPAVESPPPATKSQSPVAKSAPPAAEAPPPSVKAPPPPASRTSPFPGREDCWSEEATLTLIDAWSSRYLDVNRGSLRQSHWHEVAADVNAAHGHDPRSRRTDVQCKNRVDTLKKKYKVERAKVSVAGGEVYAGAWPLFQRLDSLIGDTFPAKKTSTPTSVNVRRKIPPAAKSPPWTVIPVGPRSSTQKRPAPASWEDSFLLRNFSAFAVAAAAESEESKGNNGCAENDDWKFGYRELADAIVKIGEIYERVESKKRRQMVELEKQRMQFAKDLECQRMQLFLETQLQIHKINRSSRSSADDSFS